MSPWHEKDGSNWNDDDRRVASAFLRGHEAGLLWPDPFDVVHTRAFKAALARYRGGYRYRASTTPDAFVDHVSLHLGALKRILIRDVRRSPDMSSSVSEACAALTEWLLDDPAPKRRVMALVAARGHDRDDAEGLIVLFARADLHNVVTKVVGDGMSDWDYLARAFKNFLLRQHKKEQKHRGREESGFDLEGVDPGAGPEARASRLSEEALDHRRAATVLAALNQWDAEEIQKANRSGKLRPARSNCRSTLVARHHARFILEDDTTGAHGIHDRVAKELHITAGAARVAWCRVRHRLNEATARIPYRLTSDGVGKEWVVHLNDYALRDTEVTIECEPRDLAVADAATMVIPAGVARSMGRIVLRHTPAATRCVTAVLFEHEATPGDTAQCQIRFDQVRLRATASGRSISAWVEVPPSTKAPGLTPLRLTASGPAECVTAWTSMPLPATLMVSPDETTLRTQIVVPASPPELAQIDIQPNPAIGGAPVTLTLRLGLLLAAEAAGRSVVGLLPIRPPAPVSLEVTGAPTGIRVDNSSLLAGAATLAVQAYTDPVSRPQAAEVAVRSGSREIRAQVDVVPSPPASIAVHGRDSTAPVPSIAAGATVHVTVRLASPALLDTDVFLSASHSGLTIEQPHGIVRQGADRTLFVVRAADDAKSGRAQLTARSGGGEASEVVLVDKNALKSLVFESKDVIGGMETTVTVSSLHPVSADVLLQVSSSDGGLARLSTTGSADGEQSPAVRIPRGSTSVTFHVRTGGVTKRHAVKLSVLGFGETITRDLTLRPRPQSRMDEHE